MICEQCHKNPATQVISVVRDGKTTEMGVCNDCAKKLRPQLNGMPPLADLLLGFMKDVLPPPLELKKVMDEAMKVSSPVMDVRCPYCGLSRETLLKNRLFGCAECYAAFPQDVEQFVSELQYGEQHRGRVPRFAQHRAKIADVKKDLAAAVAANDFLKAAALRDKIRAMESPHA